MGTTIHAPKILEYLVPHYPGGREINREAEEMIEAKKARVEAEARWWISGMFICYY